MVNGTSRGVTRLPRVARACSTIICSANECEVSAAGLANVDLKQGGDPLMWFNKFCVAWRIQNPTQNWKLLYVAGTYDQLILGGCASEDAARRIQSYVDTNSDKDHVCSGRDAVVRSLRRQHSGRIKDERDTDPARQAAQDGQPTPGDGKRGKKKGDERDWAVANVCLRSCSNDGFGRRAARGKTGGMHRAKAKYSSQLCAMPLCAWHVVFHVVGITSAEWEGTRAGSRANPISRTMRQFPKTSIDNEVIAPTRTVKESATRSQDGACRLEPEYSISTGVERDADTRYDMRAYGRARTRVSRNTQVSYLEDLFTIDS